jgi:hypothetical protein
LIFKEDSINQVISEYFIAAAFNTWDSSKSLYNTAHIEWGGKLKTS